MAHVVFFHSLSVLMWLRGLNDYWRSARQPGKRSSLCMKNRLHVAWRYDHCIPVEEISYFAYMGGDSAISIQVRALFAWVAVTQTWKKKPSDR